MTNVLITGGCGFVGSKLAELLFDSMEYDVTILDNCMSGQNPNPAIYHLNADIRDQRAMQLIVPNYDIVVHLAAIVGVPACSVDEQFAFDINVIGTQNIMRNLRKDAHVVFTSSTSSYGNNASDSVTEDMLLTPLTNYGLHKLYNETEVKRNTDTYIIMRPAAAFGLSARTRLDVLPNTLLYDAFTQPSIKIFEPHVMRPFIHVHDYARALQYAVDGHMAYGTYNVGDPNLTMTKGALATRITNLTHTGLEMVSGEDPDKRNYAVSYAKFLATGFIFENSALDYAFLQFQERIEDLKVNYSLYNTSYHVRRYLKEYGNELH